MARSVSAIESTSPKRTPRERVTPWPITRNCACPAMGPTPSTAWLRSGPSKRSTRQATLLSEVQDGDHAPLQRGLADAAHEPLGLVEGAHFSYPP
jgi:hypothetical protein